jgi:hypothetical protein
MSAPLRLPAFHVAINTPYQNPLTGEKYPVVHGDTGEMLVLGLAYDEMARLACVTPELEVRFLDSYTGVPGGTCGFIITDRFADADGVTIPNATDLYCKFEVEYDESLMATIPKEFVLPFVVDMNTEARKLTVEVEDNGTGHKILLNAILNNYGRDGDDIIFTWRNKRGFQHEARMLVNTLFKYRMVGQGIIDIGVMEQDGLDELCVSDEMEN